MAAASSLRLAVAARAESGWLAGMPNRSRQRRGSSPCCCKCRRESWRKLWPHTRQRLACLRMLSRQPLASASAAAGGKAGSAPGASVLVSWLSLRCVLASLAS
jgi:hypothetical protein